MIYAQETIPWDEVEPLLQEHYLEISGFHDIPLDPNREVYNALEQAGAFICFTARRDKALVGYAGYFVHRNLHYSGSLQAIQDVLFIRASERRGRAGIGLLTFADRELKSRGVQVVYQHVKTAHDFGPLLERLGYTFVEKIFVKRLDLEIQEKYGHIRGLDRS